MNRLKLLCLPAIAISFAVTSCTTPTTGTGGKYTVTAYKPQNPSNVRVKVSTSTQNIYVMEGDRCLMAVQGCVGEDGKTPLGTYRVTNKIKNKRSYSYGFTSSGAPAAVNKGQRVAVGYPMAYWVEFKPAYGFHEGFVWSVPRTHGCIRMHKEAAARFYALVRVGTPIHIAITQPEDATLGKKVRRLDQRNDPDPPTSLLMSSRWFQDPPGPLLVD
jgi:lipoprotein-anchoring transpeptidase ErfK/SrfK